MANTLFCILVQQMYWKKTLNIFFKSIVSCISVTFKAQINLNQFSVANLYLLLHPCLWIDYAKHNYTVYGP